MTIRHMAWGGTTSAGGAATDDSPHPITGEIVHVMVDGTNLTDSANLDLQAIYTDVDENEILGEKIIVNVDVGNAPLNEFYPSTPFQDSAGVDKVYALSDVVPTLFCVAGARLRVTISSGGNAVAYRITVVYRE